MNFWHAFWQTLGRRRYPFVLVGVSLPERAVSLPHDLLRDFKQGLSTLQSAGPWLFAASSSGLSKISNFCVMCVFNLKITI